MSRERQPEKQEVKGWQVLLSQLLGGWKTPDGSQQAQQILDEMDYPSFASLLPYRRYDPDSELFVNARTAGFILECAPLFRLKRSRICAGLFLMVKIQILVSSMNFSIRMRPFPVRRVVPCHS